MAERHQFSSEFYNITLKKIFKKEIICFLGKLFSKKQINVEKEYLQLGCGSDQNALNDSYINCDIYNINFFKFYKKKKIHYLDLRNELPFKENSFIGVFSEHTIEHLVSLEALKLFSEIHRVLKPDGIFRLIVPDLKKYIDHYNGYKVFPDGQFKSGCEAIWNICLNYEHKSVWDENWLTYNLKNSNFKKIICSEYKVSLNEKLLLDKKGREIESIYIEAIK